MFSNSKSKDTGRTSSTTSGPSGNAFNSLVQGTVVQGDIKSKSDIRVDGKIVGKLNCEAKVVVGPTGSVEGEVHCQNAVIEGNFEGKLLVHSLLTIKETAKVQGEIRYGKLVVQPGATLIGDVRLVGSANVSVPSKEKTQPNLNAGKANPAGKPSETKAANR
jgi:cytoskeletal protein CcmA (bactofilin family)